jgi:peroxiredoxin
MTMTGEGPRPLSTDDIFKGAKVALLALPGAFTPTCSAKHLPGYKEKVAEFKAKGVDKIVCVSVNDVFVMGLRSQRYSMVVTDGVVSTLNVEEGGEFKVSAADYMLGQL